MLMFVLAGCGYETYMQRQKNAQDLFGYMSQLDAALGGPWTDRMWGTSLRVPTQFSQLPDPEPEEETAPEEAAKGAPKGGEKGGDKAAPKPKAKREDERQPTYVNVEWPGLLGAFRAELKVDEREEVVPKEGFIYVMGNQQLIADGQPEDVTRDYHNKFRELMSQAVNEKIPDDKWQADKYPRRAPNFVDRIPYQQLEYTTKRPLQGFVRQFRVYMYEKGQVQIVVLVVIPEGVVSSESIDDRIALMLGTLNPGRDSITPGAAPTGGAGPAAF